MKSTLKSPSRQVPPALLADNPDDEPTATSHETRMALLDRSNRSFAVILKVFVQKPAVRGAPRGADRSGPLSKFVAGSDLRGLQAMLLLNAFISSGEAEDGWSATHPIRMWARAFNTTESAESPSASSAVSKILTRLEDRKLITRTRQGRERKVKVTLLHPEGYGDPFRRKGEDEKMVPYLKLPHVYWEKWFDILKVPELAMLLVMLHAPPKGFSLAAEWFPTWYGWSADTAERGLKRLRGHGIVESHSKWRTDPLSPIGRTQVITYTLAGDFARPCPPDAVKGGDQQ